MKKYAKSLCLFLVLALSLFMFIGCGQSSKPSQQEKPQSAEQPEESPAKEPELPKVALLLPGPINDGGWNAIAYNGLKLIGDEYGAEIVYVENVKTSDMEEMFRNFAGQGFGVVIGHGFEFGDAAAKVAPDFPEVKFVVTSSDISQAPNLGSLKVNTTQQGFISGATAALLSETNKVGALGGMEIPPIKSYIEGFEKGAKHVNPDVTVLTGFTGSMEDSAKMKEMMTAFIQQGVDAGAANGDQSGLGGLEALKEADKIAIGVSYDQSQLAPQNIPLSVSQSYPLALSFLYNEILEGRFEAKAYLMGVKEGAVGIIYNESFELPGEVKTQIEAILQDLADGKIGL